MLFSRFFRKKKQEKNKKEIVWKHYKYVCGKQEKQLD